MRVTFFVLNPLRKISFDCDEDSHWGSLSLTSRSGGPPAKDGAELQLDSALLQAPEFAGLDLMLQILSDLVASFLHQAVPGGLGVGAEKAAGRVHFCQVWVSSRIPGT